MILTWPKFETMPKMTVFELYLRWFLTKLKQTSVSLKKYALYHISLEVTSYKVPVTYRTIIQ